MHISTFTFIISQLHFSLPRSTSFEMINSSYFVRWLDKAPTFKLRFMLLPSSSLVGLRNKLQHYLTAFQIDLAVIRTGSAKKLKMEMNLIAGIRFI